MKHDAETSKRRGNEPTASRMIPDSPYELRVFESYDDKGEAYHHWQLCRTDGKGRFFMSNRLINVFDTAYALRYIAKGFSAVSSVKPELRQSLAELAVALDECLAKVTRPKSASNGKAG